MPKAVLAPDVPRVLLQADGLAKSFGGKTLLDGASCQLESGERVALVGMNGTGKSTLMRLVTAHERADAGTIWIASHCPVTYFTQHPEYEKGATIRDVLTQADGVPPDLAAELADLEARMADPALYESGEADEVVARYGEVQREIAHHKSANSGAAADTPLLAELGFTESDLTRQVASLSGGERTRLFLARTLTQADPQGLLLLDEPTNNLDVETIEWLEDWLHAYEGGLLLVSHDRAFLDNVATRVLAIERGELASYPGNYSDYERAREEDATRLLMQREREAKELERQKDVIEQFRHQKRFNGQMASRLTRLARYRSAIDTTPDPLVNKLQWSAAFPETFKSSNDVIRVRGLAKRYDERILFYGLDFDVNKGDRIGLVAPNGSGKTTLLRILTGRETKDLGNIEVAPGVKGAFYAQGSENLDPKKPLRDEVLSARPGLEIEDVRALLGKFGFRSFHDADRKVDSLSGGERARLALLKCVIGSSNLLILDEPTNHLDVESTTELVRALNGYKGTLLVVSHDRWFLDSVVNKVAVLGPKGVKVYAGDFTNARLQAALEGWGDKATKYVVRKGFKDYDAGIKYAAGTTLEMNPQEFSSKRLWKTALDLGWMEEEAPPKRR